MLLIDKLWEGADEKRTCICYNQGLIFDIDKLIGILCYLLPTKIGETREFWVREL